MPYSIAIASSVAALTAGGGTANPMVLPPQRVVYVPPEAHYTASGYRKLLGKEGRDLFWTLTDMADLYDIFSKSGGTSASSIFGAIRCQDWQPRSSAPTWSVYTAYIHAPITGEWRIGNIRYDIKVEVRRMTVDTNLS